MGFFLSFFSLLFFSPFYVFSPLKEDAFYSKALAARKSLCLQYCDFVESPCLLIINAPCKAISKFLMFNPSVSNFTFKWAEVAKENRSEELNTWTPKGETNWLYFSGSLFFSVFLRPSATSKA